MSDDLRERIAKVLYYRSMHFAVTERVWEEEKDVIYAFRDDAQAIIDGSLDDMKAAVWDEAIDAAAAQGTIQIPDNPYRKSGADQ